MKNILILDNYRLKNLFTAIFIATIGYFFFLFLIEKIEIDIFFYLIFLFFVNCSLFYIYFNSQKEKNHIPIYPQIIFYYFVTFSCYFYFHQEMVNDEFSPNVEQIYSSTELMHKYVVTFSCGLIFFSIGYFLMNFFNYKNEIYTFQNINKFDYLLIFLFVMVLIVYYLNFPARFFSISVLNQLKQPLILFILAFLQIKYLESNKKPFLYLNILLTSVFFIIELSFGSIVFPFLIVAMLISLNYHKSRKVNLLTIFIVCISIFYIHSIKLEIRSHTWFDKSIKTETEIKKQMWIIDNIAATSQVFIESLLNEFDQIVNKEQSFIEDELIQLEKILKMTQVSDEIMQDTQVIQQLKEIIKDSKIKQQLLEQPNENLENLLIDQISVRKAALNLIQPSVLGKKNISWQGGRFFHSNHTFQVVLDKTPNKIDYMYGASLKHIIYQIIPRFINPNKKQELWGNYWGKRYGVLKNTDFHTSWNFPVLTEFYANYGLKGVCIGMFLLGLILKLIILLLNFNTKNSIEFSAIYVIVSNFFFQESNLSQITGAAINQSIFFVVIFITFLLVNSFIEKFSQSKNS